MLKRVADLPKRKCRGRVSYVAKDVREFIRNQTYDVAEVTYEGKKSETVYKALHQYITSHPDQCAGVRVTMRGGRVYLCKEMKR